MPERQQTGSSSNDNNSNNNDNDSASNEDDALQQQSSKSSKPMAKLVIEEPRVSDEALYKCDVTYVKGKCPSISLVRVQMLALPDKAQIISNNIKNQLSSSTTAPSGEIIPEGYLVGPYNEHEQLKLTCLVYGGRPQPKSVIWRKIDTSGRTTNLMPLKYSSPPQSSSSPSSPSSSMTTTQPVTAIRQQSSQNVVQVDLNHTLTSADLGAKFECHVEHEAIEQLPTARVVSSSNNNIASESGPPLATAQSHDSQMNLHDSLLDLHPSDQMSSEASTSLSPSVLLSQTTNSRSKSLDSHVIVDLNGKLVITVSPISHYNLSAL